jgi:lipoprotein-anchoring transpeptidase ErfK/SrfK
VAFETAARRRLSRRAVLAGLGGLLTGCATLDLETSEPEGVVGAHYDPRYTEIVDEGWVIPAVDLNEIDPGLLRSPVPYPTSHRAGTLVVDIASRHLYLVQGGGQAMRYSVGVGREEALNFHGAAVVGRKALWPSWTPTASMIAQIPRYAAYAGGMPGGIGNPLGARALYLYRGQQDTHFRIHGTNEPGSIGGAVSSGCIRLLNHDVIDLYARTPLGSPVIVVQHA